MSGRPGNRYYNWSIIETGSLNKTGYRGLSMELT